MLDSISPESRTAFEGRRTSCVIHVEKERGGAVNRIISCVMCIVIFLTLTAFDDQSGAVDETEDFDSCGTGSPPVMVSFSTIEEMRDFISAYKASDEEFEKHVKSLKYLISVKDAQKAAKNIISQPLPIIESALSLDGFGATHYDYGDRQSLHVIYRINGSRYRFIYTYNSSVAKEYDGTPALDDVKIGAHSVDLYSIEDCFIGSFLTGTCRVEVTVFTSEPDDVNFDVFEFEYLSEYNKIGDTILIVSIISSIAIVAAVVAFAVIRRKKKNAIPKT